MKPKCQESTVMPRPCTSFRPRHPSAESIKYYLTPHKRPVGRPVLTWIALVSKDLQNTFRHHKIKSPLTSISLNKLKDLAADRVVWRGEIH